MGVLSLTNRLQFRVNLVFAVIMAVTLLVMINASIWLIARALYDSEEKRIYQVVNSISLVLQQQSSYVEHLAANLATFAKFTENPELLPAILKNRLKVEASHSLVTGAGIWPEPYTLYPDREKASIFWGISKQGGLRLFSEYNAADSPAYYDGLWYQGTAFLGKTCFWTSSYSEPFMHQLVTTCAYPIYKHAKFWGVANVDISLHGLSQLLQEQLTDLDAYALVLDRNLNFISYANSQAGSGEVGKNTQGFFQGTLDQQIQLTPAYTVLKNMISDFRHFRNQQNGKAEYPGLVNKEAGYYTFEDTELIKRYLQNHMRAISQPLRGQISYDPAYEESTEVIMFHLPKVDWYLAMIIPKRLIYEKAQQVAAAMFAIMVVSVVLGALYITYWLSKDLIKPIRNMIDSLRGSEEKYQMLDESCDHELGELARAYNKKQQELEASNASIEKAKERYQGILENSFEAILVIDSDFVIREFNPASVSMLRCKPDLLIGKIFLDFLPDYQRLSFTEWMQGIVGRQMVNPHVDATLMVDTDEEIFVELSASHSYEGSQALTTLFMRDVSQRKISERTMQQLATTDVLTQLDNRAQFNENLQLAVMQAKQNDTQFALLMIDLDFFKEINDVRGHDVGDQLLIEVAKRLRKGRRSSDTIARLGGDEFAIILQDCPNLAVINRISNDIVVAIKEPFILNDEEACHISASIGVAVYPEHAITASDLMRQADIAMYQAKDDGRNAWRYFSNEQLEVYQERRQLIQEMETAAANGEFFLEYQPIVNPYRDEVVFVEALIRWQHPRRGLLLPEEFIPVGEKTGHIIELGHWVIEQGCQWLRQCLDNGIVPPRLAINISSAQLLRGRLVEKIESTLTRYQLDGKCLVLEITESMLLDANVIKALEVFRHHELKIAIDDFGTGYSSLTYLQDFPIDFIKIDNSFISSVTNPQKNALIKTVIQLAHNLGTRVIAEGVESQAQYDAMLNLRCDYIQGFWLTSPLPEKQVMEWLNQPKSLDPDIHEV